MQDDKDGEINLRMIITARLNDGMDYNIRLHIYPKQRIGKI